MLSIFGVSIVLYFTISFDAILSEIPNFKLNNKTSLTAIAFIVFMCGIVDCCLLLQMLFNKLFKKCTFPKKINSHGDYECPAPQVLFRHKQKYLSYTYCASISTYMYLM